MLTVAALSLLLVLLASSFATAVVPVGPPEAMVVALTAAAVHSPGWAVVVAATAAGGQAVGKLLVFRAVRCSGPGRWRATRRVVRHPVVTRLAEHISNQPPRRMVAMVGLSALASLPPLAVVSPLAGSTTMPSLSFVASAFTGRLVRFGALAVVPTLLWW